MMATVPIYVAQSAIISLVLHNGFLCDFESILILEVSIAKGECLLR